jgi:hypothetical protein
MAALIHEYFFPLLGAGVALGAVWRYLSPGPVKSAFQTLATVVFFAPQFALFVVGNYSVGLVLHRNFLMASWLVAGGALAVWQARHTSRTVALPTSAQRGLVRGPMLLGIAGFLVGVMGLWLGTIAVRDIVLPRGVVEGWVTRMWVTTWWSGGPYWHIAVNGAPLNVTRDVYATFRPGMRVKVQVGAGSATVLAVLPRR